MLTEKIIVTSALPYANGPIHLGHLAGAYLPADIFVRYKRLKKVDIIYICGSDEHGVPITITADNERITPQEVVDRFHFSNKEAFEKFGMSFDIYSRTSIDVHHKTAQEFFKKFYEKGILVKKSELQFFDPKANKFLPDRYIKGKCPNCGNDDARGDQCESCGSYLNPTDLIDPISRITFEKPILKETVHFYFPLGKYQAKLEEYIKDKDEKYNWKENVLNYCKGWFNDGLQDRAVTRDLDWGVKLPINDFDGKVLYVWFDAVLGYISATKELGIQKNDKDFWKKYWLDKDTKYYAFIGKDNVVFHCIVFPAMLMAWNELSDEKFILPDNVPANEFLNYEGLKFSKSRGWGIDVKEFLQNFPVDSLRYYLATILPENRDSDFYWKEFQAKYNNELADIFGNFVNRTLTFLERNFNGEVPKSINLTENDLSILNSVTITKEKVEKLIDRNKIKEALFEIINLARNANKYFNDGEPWKSIKNNTEKCANTIYISIQLIKALSILLNPFIPFTTEKIFKTLNLKDIDWNEIDKNYLIEGHKINKSEILFKKIEDKEIEPFLPKDEVSRINDKDKKSKLNMMEEKIKIDEFKKIAIKTAEVISAERVQNSEKLLKLKVKIGNQEKQIIAGIGKYYEPKDILNKKVLVVANLEEAKLMGEISEGMLLAVEENKKLRVITLPENIETGLLLR